MNRYAMEEAKWKEEQRKREEEAARPVLEKRLSLVDKLQQMEKDILESPSTLPWYERTVSFNDAKAFCDIAKRMAVLLLHVKQEHHNDLVKSNAAMGFLLEQLAKEQTVKLAIEHLDQEEKKGGAS